MSVRLLDVNLLVSLLDSAHVHHKTSVTWFRKVAAVEGWASCPLTENGLVRVVSQVSYPNLRLTPFLAAQSLDMLKAGFPGIHQFWPDEISITSPTLFDLSVLTGSRQIKVAAWRLSIARFPGARFEVRACTWSKDLFLSNPEDLASAKELQREVESSPYHRNMELLDLRERGGIRDGQPQYSDDRLFMQLLAFGNANRGDLLSAALESEQIPGVLYEDVNDPRGVALLTWSTDPGHFIDRVRPTLEAFPDLTPKLEYSMLGRTYAIGHEPNLQDWLVDKPIRAATDAAQPWAIWYPLRRKGEFAQLTPEEQGPILSEHGRIGHSFGMAGFANDIRLACFGMDKNDNDFIIGLTGKDLFPLSACIQAMRKTKQTSRYIEAMGPFFIGKAVWQNAL